MKVDTNITVDGGVYSTGGVTWGEFNIETPVKANPVDVITRGDTISSEVRDLAQVCVELCPADLEAYRSGNHPNALQNLEKKLSFSIDREAIVVIFKYQDGHEIGPRDMDTFVEIQHEYADIITAPVQSQLTDPLCPTIDDGRDDLDRSPFKALRSNVEHFVAALNRKEIDKPAMGILPLVRPGHRRQILQIYEDFGTELIAVDFQGKKPTTEDVYSWVTDLISDLRKRGELESNLLYALNFRKYFDNGTSSVHAPEGLALLASGFDILGENHVSNIVVDDDFEPTNVKAFNPKTLAYTNVPLNELRTKWPQSSTISASRFAEVGDAKRADLKKLSNSESFNYALQAFRAAVENGEIGEYMESKQGTSLITPQLRRIVDAYYADAWKAETEA